MREKRNTNTNLRADPHSAVSLSALDILRFFGNFVRRCKVCLGDQVSVCLTNWVTLQICHATGDRNLGCIGHQHVLVQHGIGSVPVLSVENKGNVADTLRIHLAV